MKILQINEHNELKFPNFVHEMKLDDVAITEGGSIIRRVYNAYIDITDGNKTWSAPCTKNWRCRIYQKGTTILIEI